MSAADETADEAARSAEAGAGWKNLAAEITESMFVWTVFSVVISGLPIVARAYEASKVLAPGQSLNWAEILGTGELVLVSTVLVGASLGELVRARSGNRWDVFCTAITGVAVIWIIVGTYFYGDVSTRTRSDYIADIEAAHPTLSSDAAAELFTAALDGVVSMSVVGFVLCLVVGACTVALKHLEALGGK
jgi:hypothetical protein